MGTFCSTWAEALRIRLTSLADQSNNSKILESLLQNIDGFLARRGILNSAQTKRIVLCGRNLGRPTAGSFLSQMSDRTVFSPFDAFVNQIYYWDPTFEHNRDETAKKETPNIQSKAHRQQPSGPRTRMTAPPPCSSLQPWAPPTHFTWPPYPSEPREHHPQSPSTSPSASHPPLPPRRRPPPRRPGQTQNAARCHRGPCPRPPSRR